VKQAVFAWIAAALASQACIAADLNATERRWMAGVWPVVAAGKAAGLPLDIVVQPQPASDAAPLAMGFVDGRCKLVFSMRMNDEATATLERIEPALLDAALELMAAHELGHCRRYLDGAWFGLPHGFSTPVPAQLDDVSRAAYLQMQAVRREEGYADLVGLAWTWQHHPQHYARLLGWLNAERSRDRIPGSHHDTLAWLRLAQDGSVLAPAANFAVPTALWTAGLGAED